MLHDLATCGASRWQKRLTRCHVKDRIDNRGAFHQILAVIQHQGGHTSDRVIAFDRS
jgi:hypothetical protein